MHSTLEKLENNRVSLKIEVPAQDFMKAMDFGYRRVAQQVNIPGFRKGKAPKSVLVRHVGKEPVFKEALDKIVPEAYGKAVQENQIEPIDYPEVQIEQVGEDQPLVFNAIVQVKPEVTLGEYKNLDVKPKEFSVTEADVDSQIEALRKRHSTIEETERDIVESGDTIVLDFVGKLDGEPFENGSADDFELEIGSGKLIPGFEDQLIGAKVDEPTTITVTFPEEYPNESLAGKETTFDVMIKSLKARVLPEVDDEFAKKCGPFETVDALRDDLAKRLNETAENRARTQFDDEVLNTVVENATVEIPKILVERRTDQLVKDFEQQLSYQRMTLDDYFAATSSDVAKLREELAPRAEREVKMDLVLDKVSVTEDIKVDAADVDKKFSELAEMYRMSEADIRNRFESGDALAGLKDRILREKTVALLVDGYDKIVTAG